VPVTLRFQPTGQMPPAGGVHQMSGPRVTLGRAKDSDLVLPDSDLVVSKKHCTLEIRDGGVLLVDTSMNGTFVNYGKLAAGEGPTPLNHGDILTIGPYELVVEIVNDPAALGAGLLPPAAKDPPARAVDMPGQGDAVDDGDRVLDDFLGYRDAPEGPAAVRRASAEDDRFQTLPGEDALLGIKRTKDPGPAEGSDASILTDALDRRPNTAPIPENWGEDLDLGLAASTAPGEIIPDIDFLAGDAQPTPARTAPQTTAAGGANALGRAYLEELLGTAVDVPDDEVDAVVRAFARAFRTMLSGVIDVLEARSDLKSEFRIEQTRFGRRGNNPLKFTSSLDETLQNMANLQDEGFLGPVEAAEQAMKDIAAHELAVMTGMDAALKGMLQRFSPEALEQKIEDGGGISGMLKGKKARYWEAFEAMHADISQQAEDEFFTLFGDEFARAYRLQLERLKEK